MAYYLEYKKTRNSFLLISYMNLLAIKKYKGLHERNINIQKVGRYQKNNKTKTRKKNRCRKNIYKCVFKIDEHLIQKNY